MKNKKPLLGLMVFLMLFSLSAPAFAAVSAVGSSTVITAECNRLPTIEVTVPPSMDVVINPYRMPVVIQNKMVGDQIVCDSVAMQNKSEVPLKVSVSMTGAIREGSDMRLTSESTIGQDLTSKRAFVYFEIQATSDPDRVAWDEKYDEEKHLLVRNGTKSRKDMVTIGAAGQPLSYGAFRLTGDCVESPRTPWTEEDGIDVSIAFTFTATIEAP